MSRKRKTRDSSSNQAEWLTTYSDLVTLLLTFFVLLFSFSTIDAAKWRTLVSSLQGGIGVLDGNPDTITAEFGDMPEMERKISDKDGKKDGNTEKNVQDQFVQLYKDMDEYLRENDIQAEVQLSKTQTEILVRFREYVLFDTGKADIKDDAVSILNGVAQILKKFDNQIQRIRVEGHTDSRPINTYIYPTNWELSGGRAARVVRYFQEWYGIPGNKLSFAGYGEYYPISPNDTEEGMSQNRRVDITIVRSSGDIKTIDTKKE